MVETIESVARVDDPSNFTVPVIFVEDDGVNDQIITESSADHYSPSVRSLYVSKPIEATSGFGFHLSRSKWDPYPYISRVDKDSFASSSGLKEGDCVLEVNIVTNLIQPLILNARIKQSSREDIAEGRGEKVFLIRVCVRKRDRKKCLPFLQV